MNDYEFLARFQNVKDRGTGKDGNREYSALCPKHTDRENSLSIAITPQGKRLVKCFAGCDVHGIVTAVGLSMSDLFPEDSRKQKQKDERGKFEGEFVYKDAAGKPLAKKLKYRKANGSKTFSWKYMGPDGLWLKGRNDIVMLYGLDRLNPNDDTLFVVEGERDANTMFRLGFQATTLPESSTPWQASFDDPFCGRKVYILGDNDDTGRKYAARVAENASKVAEAVYILKLSDVWPDIPNKADISDYGNTFGADAAKAAVRKLMESAKPYTPAPESAIVPTHEQLATACESRLDTFNDGRVKTSLSNFVQILTTDPHYSGLRYNLLTQQAECTIIRADGKQEIRRWSDAEDAASQLYIEQSYGIYNDAKHNKALSILFRKREYNPIVELVESLEWDGHNHIELFLTTVMQTEDTLYTREVSRLIFAGAINRLYNPGSKFDDVVVLIGNQGCGKSTIIKWLALNDPWYAEVKDVSGSPQSVEQLFGAWICEFAELTAIRRAADVEAVKAFVTRSVDSYRKPYEKNTTVYPRRCIFIGSTNNDCFLTDRTGNRRFYPVVVHSNGYQLYEQQDLIQATIRQCYAEARERYKAGKLPPVADPRLVPIYQKIQEDAEVDDYRVGLIGAYLETKDPGEHVCIKEIFDRCIYRDIPKEPKKQESIEVSQILSRFPDWEKVGRVRMGSYGQQRCWRKKVTTTP